MNAADRPPLWGIPFAVKDNIDVKGFDTTAACKAFAYSPKETAPAVQAVLDAGAAYSPQPNSDAVFKQVTQCSTCPSFNLQASMPPANTAALLGIQLQMLLMPLPGSLTTCALLGESSWASCSSHDPLACM